MSSQKDIPKPTFTEEPEDDGRRASPLMREESMTTEEETVQRILARRYQSLTSKKDDPRWVLNLDLMPHLEKKYAKEFEEAEEKMSKKKEEYDAKWMSRLFKGDPDEMKFFEEYDNDMSEIHEKQQIHPIDEAMDHLFALIQYTGRVGTGLGLCYGLGRTRYLWKTMDKAYARVNGVRILDILMYECSLGIFKGMGLSVVGALGAINFEQWYGLIDMMQTDSIHKNPRDWKSITFAGFGGGLCSSGMLAFMNRKLFTPRMLGFMTVVPTLCATGAAWYAGKHVYQPFADIRGRSHETNPRALPWHEQRVNDESQFSQKRHLRGRFK